MKDSRSHFNNDGMDPDWKPADVKPPSDKQEGLALPVDAMPLSSAEPKTWCVADSNMRIIAPYLNERQAKQMAAALNAARSSVAENKPQMRGITDFSSAKVLDWGKIPTDHVDLHIEAERDLIQANKVIENLRAALPIGVAPKGRWQTALYYSGYWWVKKSHAENALSARVEKCPGWHVGPEERFCTSCGGELGEYVPHGGKDG